MRLRCLSFLVMVFLFCPMKNQAQLSMVSVETQKAIFTKLSKEISARYYNPSVSLAIADTLRKLMPSLVKEVSIDDFNKTINALLNEMSHDNHLELQYDKKMYASYAMDRSAIREFEYERHRKINFGLTKVEILEGNIGYINLMICSDFIGETLEQKIASAMNLVENTDALIIDLRNNGGGDGRVGEIMETYFYPEENEIYYDSIAGKNKFKVLSFVSGKRYLNRPVYVLTGLGTFSAAEGLASGLQRGKKAIVVGERTKGGGSSGGSIPIVDGFLCFIPTSRHATDEDASVKPDFEVSHQNALNFAKLHYLRGKLQTVKEKDEEEMVQWNINTLEYLMGTTSAQLKVDKRICGNYGSDRRVYFKGNQLFIDMKDKQHELIQIKDDEFVILGLEDSYGKGNRRLIFSDNQFEDILCFSGRLFKKVFVKMGN